MWMPEIPRRVAARTRPWEVGRRDGWWGGRGNGGNGWPEGGCPREVGGWITGMVGEEEAREEWEERGRRRDRWTD